MFFGLTAIQSFVAIIVIFIAVYWITPKKASWIPFLLITVLFSVLAFRIVPNETDDINRYFMQIDYLRQFGQEYLTRCFDEGINDWDVYRVCGYYFYFISKLPDNQWLPAITIFIVYGLMFLVLYKAAKRFRVKKGYLFLAAMFFISTYWYYDTAVGIRNGLAFAVVFGCAYYQLVERKYFPLCIAGYVLACLTHSAGIILVAFVILTEITFNTSGKFLKFTLIFGIAGGGALLQFLSTRTDNEFIQSIAGKAESNASGDELYTDLLYLVNIATVIVVAMVIFYVSIYILESDYTNELKRIYKYSSIVLYFLIGSVLSALIFMRISRWIVPIIGALFFMIGMQIQDERIENKGMVYYRFYAPPKEVLRVKVRPVFILGYVAYTCVHLWYLLYGSSLVWMHF